MEAGHASARISLIVRREVAAELPSLTIPQGPADLTPEWLTAALREGGVLARSSVVGFESEILGQGEGFVGTIVRLRLKLDRPETGAPETLIGKFPISLAQNRKLGEMGGAYEREILFYRELADRVPLRTPRCYYAAMDPSPAAGREQQALDFFERLPVWLIRLLLPILMWLAGLSRRRYVLLLEDLAPARVGDQVAGCERARAEAALTALAGAHAALWEDPELERLFWIPRVNVLSRYFGVLYGRYQRRFVARYGARLPPRMIELTGWLRRNSGALLDRLAELPATLTHGDYRLDNLFFSEDGSVTALDWQGPLYGPAALDVAYFITGNLRAELAAECERPLLESYHAELVRRGVRDYGLDDLLRHYELAKLYVVFRLGFIDLIDLAGRGEDLIDRWLERLVPLLPERWDDLLGPSGE